MSLRGDTRVASRPRIVNRSGVITSKRAINMKPMHIVAAILLAAAAGCASATTTVLEPARVKMKTETIAISHGEDTVPIEEEYGAYFRTKLGEELYTAGAFSEGDGLTVRYRFIQLDQGSRAARYMLGPITGKGTMTIEILFLDPEGTEVAKIHTGGEVSGRFFGGSFKSALDKAAKEAAEYAIQNFR
ncbi:MAG: DUF4410 domain-containing protein [Parvularculaceae bacterium]